MRTIEPTEPSPEPVPDDWAEQIRRTGISGLKIECQPVLDLSTDEVTQYEFLVRMQGADGELIPAEAFFATAEREGLAPAIDRWVATQAIRLIALEREGREGGRDLVLQVNLSEASLDDPGLPIVLERELSATGIDPANLILELAESAAISKTEEAKELAHGLTRLGCRLALDDFAGGFGSFAHLEHLPFDYVKIDGGLVSRLPENGVNQLVVEAIAMVIRGMGRKSIAEWVDDDRTIELLRAYGIDHAQGHQIGRPAPIASVWPESANRLGGFDANR